jgi:hypothetical protein
VDGVELPPPFADPPVPIVLGGQVVTERRDGQLMMAIVEPSHTLAWSSDPALVAASGLSRMGHYVSAMTVRQLIDIVAFLHERYRKVSPPPVH